MWMIVVGQVSDPISGGAGWVGAGLLGLVLCWLLLKHLPDKDKQLREINQEHAEVVKKMSDNTNETSERHRAAVELVLKNCREEAAKERESGERRHKEAMALLDRIHTTGRETVHATKSLDHALRLRTQLADAIQSAEVAAWTKNLDGIILSWNVAAERLLGWRQGEIVGHSIYETIVPKVRHKEEEQVLSAIARGDVPDEYETDRMHKNGRIVRLSVVTSAIRNREGKVLGASTIARKAE